MCEKIFQFYSPDTSIRQETHDPAHYVFGYDPWKEIIDSRNDIIWEKHVVKFVKYLGRGGYFITKTVGRIIRVVIMYE